MLRRLYEAARSFARVKNIAEDEAVMTLLEVIANFDKEMRSWSTSRKEEDHV